MDLHGFPPDLWVRLIGDPFDPHPLPHNASHLRYPKDPVPLRDEFTASRPLARFAEDKVASLEMKHGVHMDTALILSL